MGFVWNEQSQQQLSHIKETNHHFNMLPSISKGNKDHYIILLMTNPYGPLLFNSIIHSKDLLVGFRRTLCLFYEGFTFFFHG